MSSLVKKLIKKLHEHDYNLMVFYDDPITQMCGCTDDFQRGFDRKERRILSEILNLTQPGDRAWHIASTRIEKYFP